MAYGDLTVARKRGETLITAPAASSAGFFFGEPMRIRAYIDGLNLYYGSLKGHPERKWLDIVGLVDDLMPGHDVNLVRYFSAPVSGKADPRANQRQEVYLRALRSSSRFTDVMGRFRSHVVDMPLAIPTPGGPRMAQVVKTEEKGSDVNLATYLLVDGMDRLYDAAIVISNDSDLVEPIAIACHRFGPVHIITPNDHRNDQMACAGASYRRLDPALVLAHQLPARVELANGKVVTRPRQWTGTDALIGK